MAKYTGSYQPQRSHRHRRNRQDSPHSSGGGRRLVQNSTNWRQRPAFGLGRQQNERKRLRRGRGQPQPVKLELSQQEQLEYEAIKAAEYEALILSIHNGNHIRSFWNQWIIEEDCTYHSDDENEKMHDGDQLDSVKAASFPDPQPTPLPRPATTELQPTLTVRLPLLTPSVRAALMQCRRPTNKVTTVQPGVHNSTLIAQEPSNHLQDRPHGTAKRTDQGAEIKKTLSSKRLIHAKKNSVALFMERAVPPASGAAAEAEDKEQEMVDEVKAIQNQLHALINESNDDAPSNWNDAKVIGLMFALEKAKAAAPTPAANKDVSEEQEIVDEVEAIQNELHALMNETDDDAPANWNDAKVIGLMFALEKAKAAVPSRCQHWGG